MMKTVDGHLIKQIDHLNRHVSNVDAFIVFYSDALGYGLLKKGIKANGKPYAILRGAGHELFISEKDGFAPETEKNFRHIGYAVDDADKLLADLKSKGYLEEGRQVIVKQFSRQIYITDPDGFEIDLIQWTDKQGFYNNLKSSQ
jgi:catechol 2,3-dioxygenase-like lactoylglutathione lyase family enzyme